jgi:transposase
VTCPRTRGQVGTRSALGRPLHGLVHDADRDASEDRPGRSLLDAPFHRLVLASVLAHCPELNALAGHVRSFADMLVRLQGERLSQWINDIQAVNLPRLHNFAAGLLRDLPAVTAGLTLQWNSGAVEGHVNRIKMLKRQMFGRAGFHLLRKRTLLA